MLSEEGEGRGEGRRARARARRGERRHEDECEGRRNGGFERFHCEGLSAVATTHHYYMPSETTHMRRCDARRATTDNAVAGQAKDGCEEE